MFQSWTLADVDFIIYACIKKKGDDMKNTHVRLTLVVALSLFLLVAFYNKAYADIKKSEAVAPLKTPAKLVLFRPDIKQFAWVVGQPLVTMLPVSEGLCALTGVSGNFRGGGEQVFVSQSGGYWVLGGSTMQDYLWAQAHCIKYKDFGKNFANIRYYGQSDWLGCNAEHCDKQELSIYYSQACKAVFLQGVSGDFERPSMWNTPKIFAGYVTTQEGYKALGVSVLGRGIQGVSGRYFYATMRGIVGCLGGNVPDMMDKNTHIVQRFLGFTAPQNQDKKLNYNVSSFFCTMAGVGGFFHGGGERVNLAIDSKGEWVLQGQSMQTYTEMGVWCFQYR